MNSASRVGLFALCLAAVFAGAFAVGAAVEPGVGGTLGFRVVDRDGRTVRDFDVEHERAMHVIAARHDLTGYQHLHPRRTRGGHVHSKDAASEGREINFDVALDGAGDHRLFLQFKHDGEVRTAAFTERGADRGAAHGEEDDHGH